MINQVQQFLRENRRTTRSVSTLSNHTKQSFPFAFELLQELGRFQAATGSAADEHGLDAEEFPQFGPVVQVQAEHGS